METTERMCPGFFERTCARKTKESASSNTRFDGRIGKAKNKEKIKASIVS